MMRRIPGDNDLLSMLARVSGGIPDFAKTAFVQAGMPAAEIEAADRAARDFQDKAKVWPQVFAIGPISSEAVWMGSLPRGVRFESMKPAAKGVTYKFTVADQAALKAFLLVLAKAGDAKAWRSLDLDGQTETGEARHERLLSRIGLNISLDFDFVMEDIASGQGAQYGLS